MHIRGAHRRRLRPIDIAVCSALLLSASASAFASASASPSAAAPAASAADPGIFDSGSELQEVVVTAKEQQLKSLKQKAIYESAYGDKALDRQQLKSAGVVGGAAQALSFAPGISVSGYGQTGGTKASISINGISQGWAGASPGVVDNGGFAVSFDGIPMSNPVTGLWETPEIPQTALLEGARITYGPGDPESRWYNNIGGGINFVPVEPSDRAGGEVQLTGGSFSTENADLILQTGKIGGWETVIAGGAGRSNSFRTSPDGFAWPTRNYAGFFKTRKVFESGDVSFGAYLGDGHGWRPTLIPTTPVPGVSVNGLNQPGPLFSEQTTGYYSAVNENVWRKNDYNRVWLVYSRQNLKLDRRVTLHNQLWYRQGNRLHLHYNDYISSPTPSNLLEWNDPSSHDYGDKLWSDIYLPYNQLGVGGYFTNTEYNTLQHFYNPADCYTYSGTTQLQGYGVTINPGDSFCGSTTFPDGGYRNNFWYVTNLAAFVQDAISPISSLTITPGIRAVTFDTDYYPEGAVEAPYAELLATAPPALTSGFTSQDHGKLPATSTHFNKTEPSVTVRYQALHWLALYGNWATAYRLPPVGGGGGLYQKQLPAGDLLEKGVEWQVGGKVFWPELGDFSKILVNLNYYHLHFSNQFISSCTTSSSANCTLATGDSLYHGVNLSAEANLGALKMFTNLNIEKAYFGNYNNGATYPNGQPLLYNGLPVSDVPKSTFNVGAYYTYRLPGGIALKPRAWYQYVGEQAMWDNNLAAPSNQYLPSYGVLNMAVAATLPSSWYGNAVSAIKLKVEVMNVLDRQYNTFGYLAADAGNDIYGSAAGGPDGNGGGYVLAYPGAPRAVYGTISVKF